MSSPLKNFLLASLFALPPALAAAQPIKQDRLLYGVAYYDEYMPYKRLAQDISMMQATGINVVRVDVEHDGATRGRVRFFAPR